MNLFFWVCVTQAIWPSALALFHIPSSEVFHPPRPLRNDSYFGYSITYDQQTHQLIISAPQENAIGEVYHCEMKTQNCNPIPKTIIGDTSFTHGFWFGATVKSGPKSTVMCAPRFKEKSFRDLYGVYGKCYLYTKGKLTKLESIPDEQRLRDTGYLIEKTMDTFGWSIDVASDESIVVGGPGMFTGRAMLFRPGRYQGKSLFPPMDKINFNFGYAVSFGSFMNNKLWTAVSSTYGEMGFGVVDIYRDETRMKGLSMVPDTKLLGSMFGAVLCAAKLYGQRSDLLVGAPTYARGSAYSVGAVHLYLSIKKNNEPIYKRTIVGQSDGAYFGSAIITLGDMNGDDRDEVAIGAPYENGGRGAVYVYSGAELISEKTEKTLTFLQKIEPSNSIATHLIQSFGMSLTALLDYDDNGCNELAIGAPFSDAVVLLRCMAVITVHTNATFPGLQNRTQTGQTNFKFKVCLSVEYPPKPENITATILTTVEMIHSDARIFGNNGSSTFKYSTSLDNKEAQYCKDVPFTLPLDGNYETEISYQITLTLANDPMNMKKFDEKRVMLSDHSELKKRDAVWAAECSGNRECVPNLVIQHINFSFNDSYIIGTSKDENDNENEEFNIVLSNLGEVAYDACLRVHIERGRLFKTPPLCVNEESIDGDRLLCKPTKPLRTNNTWDTGPIILAMKQLTNQNKNITVKIQVYNQCKAHDASETTVVIPIKADTGGIFVRGFELYVGEGERITVQNVCNILIQLVQKLNDVTFKVNVRHVKEAIFSTDVGNPVDMTKDDVYYDGKQIEHIYTIVNRGPSNWMGLNSLVELQVKPYIKYNSEGTVYVSTSRSYSECKLWSNDTEHIRYMCYIDSLKVKKETVKIVVPMFIVPGVLVNLENQPEEFSSNITLFLDNAATLPDYKSQSISTTLKRTVVPLWVIFLAALVGLFILILMAYSLYECGFLRRKNRDELKNLQRSVNRQSIMRQSMRMPQSQAEDRKQILESTSEEHEDIELPCPDKATAAK